MRLPSVLFIVALTVLGTPTASRLSAQESNGLLHEHLSHVDLEFRQKCVTHPPVFEPAPQEFELTCAIEEGDCCPDKFDPLDTLMLFLGLEGSKQPQDFGVNAHLAACPESCCVA
jgi:hypothetical protein